MLKRRAIPTAFLLLAFAASRCGAPAQAEPLEVTYYYLPG